MNAETVGASVSGALVWKPGACQRSDGSPEARGVEDVPLLSARWLSDSQTLRRRQQPSCERCRYWEPQPRLPGDEVHIGNCRRFPPRDIDWAATAANDWCGEFSERTG